MKKILITGIAGLLGSRLADWIIKNTKRLVRKQKTWFRTQLPQADQIINMTNIT